MQWLSEKFNREFQWQIQSKRRISEFKDWPFEIIQEEEQKEIVNEKE